MKRIKYYILSFFIVSSCMFEDNTLEVTNARKKRGTSSQIFFPKPILGSDSGSATIITPSVKTGANQIIISRVHLINDNIYIEGSGLDKTNSITVESANLPIKSLVLSSKTLKRAIVSTLSNFRLPLNEALTFVLTSANGSSSTTIKFNLLDDSVTTDTIKDGEVMSADLAVASITSTKIHQMGASAGDYLRYVGGSWTASPLSTLTYGGVWDAAGNNPVLADGSADLAGTYYISSSTGQDASIASNANFLSGDWIISDGTNLEKISNAGVTTLGALNDVSLTAPVLNQVMIFDGASWVNIDYTLNSFSDITNFAPNDHDLLSYNTATSKWEKKTIDNVLVNASSLDATKLSGVLPVLDGSNLINVGTGGPPSGAAAGDLSGNSPNPILSSVGTAATYTKVTTDIKGRVIAGTSLLAADIPSLAATVITSGKFSNSRLNIGTGATDVSQGDHSHSSAISSGVSGFLTGADKAILDSLNTNTVKDSDFTTAGILKTDGSGSYSIISDGNNGDVLTTNGSGTYSWSGPSSSGMPTPVSKTADFNVLASENNYIYLMSGTSKATLPSAASAGAGFSISFKRVGDNLITVKIAGADLLDGMGGAELSSKYALISLTTDGSQWYITSALGTYNLTAAPVTGVIDLDFETDGIIIEKATAGGTNTFDEANAMAVDSTGAIIVVGRSFNASGEYDMVIWKYNSNGTLDTNFDSDGIVTHHNAAGGNSTDYANGIVLDSSDNIYVTGSSKGVGTTHMVVWKYSSSGVLDNSFSGDGIMTYDSGSHNDSGRAITLDNNNKILVVGGRSPTHPGSVYKVVWRYNTDGTLDTTFNTVGFHETTGTDWVASSPKQDNGLAIKTDNNNKIVIVGRTLTGSTRRYDMVVWRLTTAGIPDTTFNGTWHFTHNQSAGGPMNSDEGGNDFAFDSSNRIVIVGYADKVLFGDSDMLVWRLTDAGILDTSFSTDGFHSFGEHSGFVGSEDYAQSIKIDSSGNYIIVGAGPNAGGIDEMLVVKLLSTGSYDTSFGGGDGIMVQTLMAGSTKDVLNDLVIDANGLILFSGYTTDPVSNKDMVLIRVK